MKKIIGILMATVLYVPVAMAVTTNSSVNLAISNNADGWQAAGGTTARLLTVTGAARTLNATQDILGANTFTWPSATDTIVGRASTDTLTNKTITNSSDVLGGVTMTLGSDANGDTYYRASGVLTRLAPGTTSQVHIGGTVPSWGAVNLGTMVTSQLPLASGGTGANLSAPGSSSLFGYDTTDTASSFISIGTGLTYTHSTHTLSASGGSFIPIPTTVVTGTSQSASTNNMYVSNNAGLVTVTLPASASVGDEVIIGGLGAGGWQLNQNASQLIHFGSTVTTTGTGGSLASNNQYDSVHLKCVVTNTTWIVIGSQGNITVT